MCKINWYLMAFWRTSRTNFGFGCSGSKAKQSAHSCQDQLNLKLLKWYANHDTNLKKKNVFIKKTKRTLKMFTKCDPTYLSKAQTCMDSIREYKISVVWANTSGIVLVDNLDNSMNKEPNMTSKYFGLGWWNIKLNITSTIQYSRGTLFLCTKFIKFVALKINS